MDCRTALEILEVARPDTDDLSAPELAEAAAHLESHADCREEFQRRQQLDRGIGRVMRDVRVPAGLREQLLTMLAVEEETSGSAEPVTTKAPVAAEETIEPPAVVIPAERKVKPWYRRAAFQAVAGTVVCAAVLFAAAQFLLDGTGRVSVRRLPGNVALSVSAETFDFAGLDDFHGAFAPQLPAAWELSRSLHISGPKAIDVRQDKVSLTAAMYQFRFTSRDNPVTGYLLVMPAARVRQADQLGSLASASTTYPKGTTARSLMAARSWKDGGLVYVAVVPSGNNNMDRLLRLLTPRTA